MATKREELVAKLKKGVGQNKLDTLEMMRYIVREIQGRCRSIARKLEAFEVANPDKVQKERKEWMTEKWKLKEVKIAKRLKAVCTEVAELDIQNSESIYRAIKDFLATKANKLEVYKENLGGDILYENIIRLREGISLFQHLDESFKLVKGL